jgi:ribonuclease HI
VIDEDKLVWVDNMYGEYGVRSGYNLWMDFLGKTQNSTCHGDWNSLWKIHAPPKAKHLLWRICRGCLPTRTRLQERCVSCPSSCPLCDHGIEDDMHVLFHCDFSAQSRISAGLDQFLAPWLQQHQNLRDTILNICSSNDKNAAGLFATLIWVLWNNRNNSIWNNTKEQGRSLGYKAKHMWEEWHSVQHLQSGRHVPVQQQHVLRWQKPSDGWLKCNVDAAFHSEQNRTSVGWCLRDHQGMFVRAGTSWVEGTCSVIEGEAMALLTALRELEEQGFSQVIIETDSQSLVTVIPHIHVGNSEFSAIVCQIKNTMLLNPNFKVRFVKRQANIVAHSLARAAISWPRRYLFDSLPLCIATYLHNEMI